MFPRQSDQYSTHQKEEERAYVCRSEEVGFDHNTRQHGYDRKNQYTVIKRKLTGKQETEALPEHEDEKGHGKHQTGKSDGHQNLNQGVVIIDGLAGRYPGPVHAVGSRHDIVAHPASPQN